MAKDRQREYRLWLARGLQKPGKSQSGLARHLGLDDPSRMNKVISGKRRLQVTELFEASEYLEEPLPADWPEALERPTEERPHRGIPLNSEVAAGLWLEVGALSEEPLGWVEDIEPIAEFPSNATFALRVRGNSVDKSAPDGSLLICVDFGISGLAVMEGDLVIVQRTRAQGSEREVTAKRVKNIKGGVELIPESNDPRWKPVRFIKGRKDADIELTIVALVKWVMTSPNKRRENTRN